MTQIQTTQNTFGKKTQRQIRELAPATAYFKKVGADYVAKDANGQTLATWHKQAMTTGLIVLWSAE